MRVLYIGGTGEISASCVNESIKLGHDVTIFNRGNRVQALPESVSIVNGDMSDDVAYKQLAEGDFDSVCQFFTFQPEDAERDIRFFSGHTGQYVFISTASAYEKPIDHYAVITEDTPLNNRYWEYSQKKTKMEQILFAAHAEAVLPVTVVRPSHTYRAHYPTPIFDGDWTAKRMLDGKPILVQGDGSSLWTLTHADDFAKPFARLLGNDQALGEAFHITADMPYTWLQILRAMAGSLNVELKTVSVSSETILQYAPTFVGELLGDKTPSTVFNNDKIKAVAGDYICEVTLEEGMAGVARTFFERLDKVPERVESERLCDQIIADQSILGGANSSS